MTYTESQLTEAQKLGTGAFSKEEIFAPALDKNLMEMLKGSKVGEATPLLEAWVKGWTLANLNAEYE